MATYTPDQVIAAYVNLLQELAEIKGLKGAPEYVLPLPKSEMTTLLQRSTDPNKEKLIEMLDMFDSGGLKSGMFISKIILTPSFLTIAYAVVIAIQKASWLWVPVALLGAVGAFLVGIKSQEDGLEWISRLPKWKQWCWLLVLTVSEWAAVGCWGAIWVRMVLMGGLYGLYQHIWVRLDWLGILGALLSLVVGYFFSKRFNSFFFFLVQSTSLRKFRDSTIAEP